MTENAHDTAGSFAIPEGMVVYYLRVLKRGPLWSPEETPEVARLQAEHVAYGRSLIASGKLILNGPVIDNGDLRVRGKFMVRLREDGETLVVKISEAECDFRLTTDPTTFFITDHYRGYSMVLVRLAQIDPDDLSDVIEQSWRWLAPRRLVAEYERAHPGQPISPLRDEEG